MKQFTDSVRLNFLERLTSPLFGAFVVAWCAWNYRFLVVLLSDVSSVEKFRYIDTVLYPKYYGVSVIYLFAAPFLSAMAFVFVYPMVSKIFYGYWHTKQCELKKLRDDIEGATLLTVEESRTMHKSMVQAEIANRETIQYQAHKIEQLQGILAEGQKKHEALVNDHVEVQRSLSDVNSKLIDSQKATTYMLNQAEEKWATQADELGWTPDKFNEYFLRRILVWLYMHKDVVSFEELADAMSVDGMPRMALYYYLDAAIEKQAVEKLTRQDGPVLILTSKGREIAKSITASS